MAISGGHDTIIVLVDVQDVWKGGQIYFGKRRRVRANIKNGGIIAEKLKRNNVAISMKKGGLCDFNIDLPDQTGKFVLITPIASAPFTIKKLSSAKK